MSYEVVARRYARAILELGKEGSELGRISRDLSAFAEMLGTSEELRGVLDSPLIADKAREGIVAELAARLGLSPLSTNALRLLARNRRVLAIPEIARQLAKLSDDESGVVRALVTSAGPLDDAFVARLQAQLERSTNRKVVILKREDASLIGGIITQIGDQVIDGSVRGRLNQFRESLLRTS